MAATPKRKVSTRRKGKRLASRSYVFGVMDRVNHVLAQKSRVAKSREQSADLVKTDGQN